MICFNCNSPGHFARECPIPPREIKTYLAEIEDGEGHPLAIRVPVGVVPTVRPPCQHAHSLMCSHD